MFILVYRRLSSEQQEGLDAVHLEVSENIVKANAAGASMIPIGRGVQVGTIAVKGAILTRRLNRLKQLGNFGKQNVKQLNKTIRTQERTLATHKKTLQDYIKDPISGDNKGRLKGTSLEQRQNVINGRIKELRQQIKGQENNLKKAQEALKIREKMQ